ncbi:MAG: spermidine/putrescine ABC transporter substrate-binding protein [Kaiparowitsia implicata GSE-PSE-MK54-09C]|jgi:spermidine/putrescine transport system substrate-binding protein|nr:spermidine/putrescine ABC transporter substrate-binding protein [Kaiparowitsia implicata GSE-PSE-MK54-09C]
MSYRRNPKIRPSRRRFLQYSLAALSGVALTNCQQRLASSPGDSSDDAPDAPAATDEPLHIYTWADYANDDVFARFTERTGIETVVDIYEANEAMLARMLAGGGGQYSILYPSDYMVQEMLELDLLATIDHSQLEGLDRLSQRWQDPLYDAGNAHSVPVSWGTTGYIYDTRRLSPGPEDWDFAWDNRSALNRQITLLDDPRETIGAALKSLGYSYNSTSEDEIRAAADKLKELRPAVRAFESFGWEDRLINGDLRLCMTYSIVGNALPSDHPNLSYIIPASGSSVWTDAMVIPKTAPNPEAAYAWINFMMEPENAAFAVEQLKFATPNQDAFDQLPNELKDNDKLFPGEDVLSTCEGIAPVGEATQLYDDLWTEIRSA